VARKSTPRKKTKARAATAKKAARRSAKTARRRAPAKKSGQKSAPRPRPPGGPVWQWSAVDTAAAIRSRAISAVEVIQAHVARMHAVNPKLNAVIVDLSEEALKAAKAADNAKGERGLLHGVPVTIKENVDFAGRPNPNGVPSQMNIVAPTDSPVVRNLKNAGAIVIGLTNTPEFSFRLFTDNPLHGLTLNPWRDDITCGGSSGGAGASIAAGIGAIAHGNDIGGSLRWPAHCNGVVTIKPTQGRIPAYNDSATAERPLIAQLMSSQGPLVRSVADARLALEVMSARDARDPWWVPAPFSGPAPKRPIKVALAKTPDDMDVHPSVRSALRQAADHLERAGYRVSEVAVPDIRKVWQTWCNIIINEVSVMQEAAWLAVTSEDFHKAWDGMKVKAETLDLAGWMRTSAARSTHIRAWQLFLEEYPVVLAPTTVQPTPAPRADTTAEIGNIFANQIPYISSVNLLGLPSTVVPVALHEGQPIGVQLIAGRYREDLSLDAAAAVEKRAGMLVRKLWDRLG
jgi:amidase